MSDDRSAESPTYSVAGDNGVGEYEPPASLAASWPRVTEDLLRRMRSLPGATSTASDLLDDLGIAMVADGIVQRSGRGVLVGHVLTLSYLPERRAASDEQLRRSPSRLAHHRIFESARPGDVVVIDARGFGGLSVLGGMAASSAVRAGVSGCIVDGGVRDIDELRASGLSVWSRSLTPRTGKWRLEATAMNQPVLCGGVHVEPGDLAVADETGVCFLPGDRAAHVLARILDVVREEERQRVGDP
jgi:regulator of RNase E activity RraA